MHKLYVLDALNFLFRSYYAIGPITNAEGASTNALFGFIRSVFKIIKEHTPDHLVIVFDGPDNKKSRVEIYSEYKSNRAEMPQDLFPQLELALTFCQIAGIPYLSIPGVEADDVMGSIARWASAKGVTTYLCSGDKDLCQLVDQNIYVLNIHKNLLMDREKVKEVFGVFPEQIIDLLAMMGDASDNIPGLPGIGAKTAVSLLNEYGSLQTLLAISEKLPEKKRKIFQEGREIALLSQKLATIHIGIPFPQNEDFFRLKEPNLEEIKAFYRHMSFMSLLKELQPDQAESASEEIVFNYTVVAQEEQLVELEKVLLTKTELCIDTETTSIHPLQAELVGVSIADKPGRAWYLPLNGSLAKERVLSFLKRLLENPKFVFFGQNIKYDLHVFTSLQIEVKNVSFDTMIASQLLYPHKPKHNLDLLALEHFDKVKIPISDLIGKGKNQISMKEVPIEKAGTYGCEDADYTFRLKQLFEQQLKEEKLYELFTNLELPLIKVLACMEQKGIFLHIEELKILQKELEEKLLCLSQEIFAEANETFNLNSPKQLGEVLFERMGIRPFKKTATGYSTSSDVLETLTHSSPIIGKIMEYRVLEKLRSTYVAVLPEQVDARTKRIHCTFNQSGTATGRLSSQDPNLQNIPVRREEGRKIRKAFTVQDPTWNFLSGDYSQIELRILAHLSEEPVLIQAFQEGEDIHTYTASLVYNVPIIEVTKAMRHAAKAVNFGILYGQQAFGLAKEIGISLEEAKEFIARYFARYKKVKQYLEFCKQVVREKGYSMTLLGRKRPIPEISSKNVFLRQAAERLAINTPLQGTAADLIKMAMIQIDDFLQKSSLSAHMLLQIHDELIFEVAAQDTEKLKEKVKYLMENVWVFKVPLIVDISIGKNWGEC